MAISQRNRFAAAILGLLLMVLSQAIILPKPTNGPILIDEAQPDVVVPIKTVPTPVATAAASTYKGTTQVLVNGELSRISFYITFSKFTEGCSYLSCYYGWVQNSTTSGGDTIQGYPKGNDAIKPVFEFKTNSKKDFVIVRNPSLADHYVNMIEIGCEFFEPTIKGVSQKTDGTSSSFSSAKAKFGGGSDLEYIFIPDSDFQRLAPQDTASLDPALLSKSGAQSKVSGLSASSNLLTASLPRQAPLQDVETTQSIVNQRVTVDGDYNIVRRSRVADVDIPSDSLADGEKQPQFVANVKILFDKSGSQSADTGSVKKIIDSFRSQTASFSTSSIQTKRSSPGKAQFTDETFTISEIPAEAKGSYTPTPTINVKSSTFVSRDTITICGQRIDIPTEQDPPPPPPPPNGPIDSQQQAPISTDPYPNPIGPLLGPVGPFNPEIPVVVPIAPRPTSLDTSNRRLLFQSSLFSYEKNLYYKKVLGRTLSVDLKVQSTVIDNTHVRLRGLITYSIFGNTRTVQAFNFVKKIILNYSKNYHIGGMWHFNIYIPFPPPVSFMGINLGFGVGYNIAVGYFIRGRPEIQNCLYKLEVGAEAGVAVSLDASAGISIIIVQGGVYIKGTLVSLMTDPKVALAFHLKDQKIVTHNITWWLYLNAFQFRWGFYIRWRRWWGGWGPRRELGNWSLGNGWSAQYLIMKT